MGRKLVFVLCLLLLLSSSVYVRFNRVEVASDDYPVHNIDTRLDYVTIQEAIDAPETLDGHTIFVETGIYYEQVTINKSINLQGEDRETTIVDGNKTGTVVYVTSSNVTVSGFTVQNSGSDDIDSGIYVYSSNDNNISLNIVTNNNIGIHLHFSDINTLTSNNASSNSKYGILLDGCCNNLLARNTASNNLIVGIRLCERSDNNTLAGNAVSNTHMGIQLLSSSNNNTLTNNNVANNGHHGIWLWGSSNNTLVHNKIENNKIGLRLYESSSNQLRNNSMTGNQWNFGVDEQPLKYEHFKHFIQDIDTSNTVDGKPIYYWVNKQNEKIPLDAGFVGLVNSTSITVENLELTNQWQPLLLIYTKNSLIKSNNLTNNLDGINLVHSSNNTLVDNNITNNAGYSITLYSQSDRNMLIGNDIANKERGLAGLLMMEVSHNLFMDNSITNTDEGIYLQDSNDNEIIHNKIADNKYGVRLYTSSNNRIYHNNFINNTNQAWVRHSWYPNFWDNGYPSGGNYWSDYNGTDSDPDGVGDTAYVIEAYSEDTERNKDLYPLMGSFSTFNTSLGYHVDVISNSTIEDLQFFESNRTIKIHVSNSSLGQTFGFCRIRIPHALINETYHVIIERAEPHYINYTLYDDGENRLIYFSYRHSTLEIIIIDIFDLVQVASAYGTSSGDDDWSPVADANGDGIIDIFDLVLVAGKYF
jgi:parallel beta-helix repeat protein